MNRVAVLIVMTTLAQAACAVRGPEPVEIDYRTIVGGLDERASSSQHCQVDTTRSFRYQYLLGEERMFEASDRPSVTLPLRSDGIVTLIKTPVPRSERSFVFAEYLFPSESSRETTLAALSSKVRGLFDCDLLVTIGGESVGVIRRGQGISTKGIQIGLFPSYESAESILAGSGVQIERAVANSEAVRHDEAFAKWIEERTDWYVQCDEELRTEAKRLYPAAFEELSRRPRVDCGDGPPDPP